MSPVDGIPPRRSLSDLFDRSGFFLFLMLFLILVSSLFVVILPKSTGFAPLIPDQIAPYTLCADFDFLVEDKEKTAALRREVADREPDYYQIIHDDTRRISELYQNFFAEVRKRDAVEKTGRKYAADPANDIQILVAKLDANTLKCFLRIADNPAQKEKMDSLFRKALNEGVIRQDVRDNLKSNVRIKIIDPLNRRRSATFSQLVTPLAAAREITQQSLEYYDAPDKSAIIDNVTQCLEKILQQGNLQFDQAFTEGKKSEAAGLLAPVRREIFRGTVILEKNKKVTEEDIAIRDAYYKELRARTGTSGVYKMIRENILLCLAVILSMGMYLHHIKPGLARSNRSVWLLGLVTILALLLNRFFMDAFRMVTEQVVIPRDLIYFAVPIGIASVLTSVIYGVRAATFVGLFVSVVAALPMENQFQMMLTGLLVNAGGSIAVRKAMNYRSFFIRAFLGTALSTLAVALIFFLKRNPGTDLIWWLILFSFVMGLLTAIIAQLLLFLLEWLFDISTTMSLLICSDFNHPLLKELQFKAPGTYHHSLMVSNMAEQAAREAGLDQIKARVCALFHDVGKIQQPEFFIENSPGTDMHKDLDPAMSAMIIRSHVVKHGPELARKYKLKRILYDTITCHHGTDLIAYFYKKAQLMHPDKHVPESDFRYPGPLPSEKEVALVMLADCCEAASRSLEKPTPAAIEQLVCEIFRKKIRDGQLDNSTLTLKELALIRKSFINTLEHMNHGRIIYPKDDKKDEDDLFVAAGEGVSPAPGK